MIGKGLHGALCEIPTTSPNSRCRNEHRRQSPLDRLRLTTAVLVSACPRCDRGSHQGARSTTGTCAAPKRRGTAYFRHEFCGFRPVGRRAYKRRSGITREKAMNESSEERQSQGKARGDGPPDQTLTRRSFLQASALAGGAALTSLASAAHDATDVEPASFNDHDRDIADATIAQLQSMMRAGNIEHAEQELEFFGQELMELAEAESSRKRSIRTRWCTGRASLDPRASMRRSRRTISTLWSRPQTRRRGRPTRSTAMRSCSAGRDSGRRGLSARDGHWRIRVRLASWRHVPGVGVERADADQDCVGI